jgi:hypothetical protein
MRRHRENVGDPRILSYIDLVSTSQRALAGRDFTKGSLFFETRIDGWYTDRHEATAVELSPLATDHVVGVKIRASGGWRSDWDKQRRISAMASASIMTTAAPATSWPRTLPPWWF